MEEELLFAGSIKRLQKVVHARAKEKGFWPELEKEENPNIPRAIAWAHSELSEAYEAARKGFPPDEHCPGHGAFEVELGDAIFIIIDLAEAAGVDLEGAMLAKMKHNRERPYKHGKDF